MDPLYVWKTRKKRRSLEKTYLEVSDRPKNILSVKHMFEILCDNNRLPNQLLLSNEIGPFEGDLTKNSQNSTKSIEILYGSTRDFTRKTWGITQNWRIFGETNFKWSYLRAQEELVGQTVVVT